MRIFVLVACVACASPPSAPQDAAATSIAISPLSPDPWDVPAPPFRLPIDPRALEMLPTSPPVIGVGSPQAVNVDMTPGERIFAMSGPIEVLAVTDDGRSAITADAGRSVRLWPTLDGRREPFVLSMRPPAMLAVTRDGDMFAIAGVDAAGQLEIVRTTKSGDRTQRIDVVLDRPIVSVHATTSGFVALRDDRAVTVVDLRGTIRTTLAPDPGEYIASLAVRGERALAMIESDDRVHGRWIDFAMWGERTPPLPIVGDEVVLSPDYEQVAALRADRKALSIVAIASGKVVRTRKDGFEPEGGAELDIEPVGFLNDRDVVIKDHNRSWWNRDGDGDGPSGRVFALANGLVFAASGSSISVTAPNGTTEYIGYRVMTLTQLKAKRGGYLATDGLSLVELDARFHTRSGFSLQDLPQAIIQLSLVGDRHAIGFSYQTNRSLYLIGIDLATATLIANNVVDYSYEPATRLLYYAVSDRAYLTRFDVAAGTFGPSVEVKAKRGEVVLLDPAQSKGDEVALLVQSSLPKLHYEATFGRLGPDAFVTTSKRDIDPSPTWWEENGNPPTLVRSTRVRARSPDRSLIAELRDQRLELRAGKTVRWTVPVSGATSLLWSPAGDLVLYGAGMATVDLETGTLRERQCGSWFGRWESEHHPVGSSQLCEVP